MEQNLGSVWTDGDSGVTEPPAWVQNSQLETVHKAWRDHYIVMTVGLQGVGAGGAYVYYIQSTWKYTSCY